MIWVFYAWTTRLIGRKQIFSLLMDMDMRLTSRMDVEQHPFAQLLFALSIGACAYNFFRAITLDPGTAPVPGSDAELKTVSSLVSHGRYIY